MSIAEAFLGEFENEMKTTRKFLERIPEDKLAWKPHEKSLSVGQLALHIAGTAGQVAQMVTQDEVAMPKFDAPPQPESLKQILDALDESTATVKQILPTFDDERMAGTWKLSMGDKEVLSMPRAAVLRGIMLNHLYHHRGQLGVYLRLLGASVPSSYGPSGDEMPDFAK